MYFTENDHTQSAGPRETEDIELFAGSDAKVTETEEAYRSNRSTVRCRTFSIVL